MAKTIELSVPDLGGYEDVPVIEVLIAAGDSIGKDAPLVTLESDKATMEVPASAAGTVREVRVRIGDRVSQGSIIANVEVADDAAPAEVAAQPSPSLSAASEGPAPAPSSAGNNGAAVSEPESGAITELIVPDLGGFENVPVISVFVKTGDSIAKDAALVELESDKATMEVPATTGGTIQDVRVKVGDTVSPGSVIATIASAVSSPATSPATRPDTTSDPAATSDLATTSQPAATSQPTTTSQSDATPQVAAKTDPVTTGSATPAPAASQADPVIPPPVLAAVVAPAPPSKNGATNGASNGVASGTVVHASPAIRRFARELGVSLSGVSGSGPNGRITRDDVQNFVKRTLAQPSPSAPPAAPNAGTAVGGLTLLPWPKIDFERYGPIERKPLSRIAKIAGQNLARNWVLIPHVTQHEDADVTDLEAFRKTINAEQKDVKVTLLALLMKALVATLRANPQFNSSLDGDELILKSYYHLGFAADTPAGLVVPVIKNVDAKGVLEIAAETSALAKKARDGKLGPGDMSGSSFTVSSLGGIGGTAFTPIVNAPEVAILGLSRTAIKPVWNGSTFEPRTLLPMSLSYDHRVIDGAAAARFCVHLAGLLADMRKTLL